MLCIKQEKVALSDKLKRVVILADVEPATFPTTGENVDGLDDFTKIAPGSTLIVLDTSTVYIANETGHFQAWG